MSLWGSDVLRRAAHPPVIQYIVFRRRNVSEIGHFFMDGVVEVKALDSMGVSSALSALANPWLGRHTVGSTSYHVVSRYREMSRPLLNLRTD